MKLLVDGKEIPVQNDVKVIWDYDDWDYADENDIPKELHLMANSEGITLDVCSQGENLPITTAWQTVEDLALMTQ